MYALEHTFILLRPKAQKGRLSICSKGKSLFDNAVQCSRSLFEFLKVMNASKLTNVSMDDLRYDFFRFLTDHVNIVNPK